jgi:hypothetical protein
MVAEVVSIGAYSFLIRCYFKSASRASAKAGRSVPRAGAVIPWRGEALCLYHLASTPLEGSCVIADTHARAPSASGGATEPLQTGMKAVDGESILVALRCPPGRFRLDSNRIGQSDSAHLSLEPDPQGGSGSGSQRHGNLRSASSRVNASNGGFPCFHRSEAS